MKRYYVELMQKINGKFEVKQSWKIRDIGNAYEQFDKTVLGSISREGKYTVEVEYPDSTIYVKLIKIDDNYMVTLKQEEIKP